MKTFIQISFYLLFSQTLFAQQTASHINNWYLGTSVGISFNTGAPTNVPSNITGQEVTTSYSDGSGNTIFYSGAIGSTTTGNGFVLWDASHNTMPNGDIKIDFSSSCGLTTAPVPGNCDQFYVFHLTSTGPGWGVHASLIDMTLPGNGTVPSPLGDVAPGFKDVLIYGGDNLSEKLMIVQKGNTENYWVIARSLTADLFYSFEVTASGINATPVVSTISATLYPSFLGSPLFGWLAVNKDRDIIAEANGFGADAKLYDFNNLTGVLSFTETISFPGGMGVDIPYGLAFSPSGNVLYVDWYDGVNTITYISSFDMTAGVGLIAATQQDYLIGNGVEYAALTRGPDGKIYGTRDGFTNLISINTPENYLAPTINLSGHDPSPSTVNVGMPNMAYYNHPDNFIDSLAGADRVVCPNGQANIGATGNDSIWGTYYWEPSAMVLNPNNATTLTVPLPVNQEFILAVVNNCGDTIKTDTVWVSATCFVLPIELLSFDGYKDGSVNHLEWTTATEINNDVFIIESSTDGINFFQIGNVPGSGNSSVTLEYNFIDDSPKAGINYYRLKQVDFDGAFSYSQVIALANDEKKMTSIYPNPTNGILNISSNNRDSITHIFVQDTQGRVIETYTTTDQINISHLSSGMYFIQILHQNNKTETLKINLY
jgi:hypothetical protein